MLKDTANKIESGSMRLKLTVILGNYNKASFLPKTLDAIFNQTRLADEIIIVDDASTDESVAVITPYLSRHPNCRLVCNPVNQGANRNVNRLMKEAQGDVLFFAPSDDWVYPRFFAEGMALLEAHPEAALFSARSDIIDLEDRNLGLFHTPTPLNTPGYLNPRTCARILMRDDSWLMGNVSLFKRDKLLGVGGFSLDLSSIADSFISRLLALKHGVCFSPDSLGAWRITKSGASWSETFDIAAARRIAKIGEQKMEAAGLFPKGYPRRWARRYLFGALRLRLVEMRRMTATHGLLRYAWAFLYEAITSAYLFIRMRPWDIWPVIFRRIANLCRSTVRR
jgi:glycosyltransferase involved in cell wall biosynthesis